MVKWLLVRAPRLFSAKRTFFSTSHVEKYGYPHAKDLNLNHYLTLYTKITQNGSKTSKSELKCLVENIRDTVRDSGFGDDFLNMIQKAQVTTTIKKEKSDFIKIKKN